MPNNKKDTLHKLIEFARNGKQIKELDYANTTGETLNWAEISQMPSDLTYYGPGTYAELFKRTESRLHFLMLTNVESTFKTQAHEDCSETLRVISGSIKEVITGVIYDTGDVLVIEPGQEHNIKTLENGTVTDLIFERK